MIYPSAGAAALTAAGAAPALLVALAVPTAWHLSLIWVSAMLGLVLVDALVAGGRGAVEVELRAPPTVGVGRAFDVALTARFATDPPARIELRLAHDDRLEPQGEAGGRAAVEGLAARVPVYFVARRRGAASLGGIWLRWPGPLGLAWAQRRIGAVRPLAVIPDRLAVRDEALALMRRDATLGEAPQRWSGQGKEFEALIDYQPGMGRRAVDWKRSARFGRLLVKDYRAEQNNSIVLAVDSGRLMCEPVAGLPRVDRAVGAAMLAAFVALKRGDLVRLFAFDAVPRVESGAARGVGSLPRLQQLAASIDYSTEETNFTLALTTLGAKLERRSLVVIFTDFVDPVGAERMLRAVGRLTERHLVLFLLMEDQELETLAAHPPDGADDIARAVTAADLLRERQLVISRLRLLGAHVLEAPHDSLGTALVARYLDIKRRDLL